MHGGDYKEFYDPSIAEEINKAIDDVEAITGKAWIGRAYNGMSWNDTNYLHRGFTTTMITDGVTPTLGRQLDNDIKALKQGARVTHFDLTDVIHNHPTLTDYYELGDKKEQLWPALHDALHRINSYIHIYESLFLRSGRANEIDAQPFIMDVDLDLKRQDGSLLYEVHEEEIQHEHKEEAFNGYDNNVYALKKILGKDYLTAYFEYDDPTKWDITNAMVTDGSMQLDYNDTYKRVHSSEGFQSWASHYGVNEPRIYSNYQIGKITNKDFITASRMAQPDNDESPRADATKESDTHHIVPAWAVINIEINE